MVLTDFFLRRLFFGILLVFLVIVHVSGQVQINIDSAIAATGDTIRMQVRVDQFENIISFQGSLNWNPDSLQYVSVSDYGVEYLDEESFGTTLTDEGKLIFIWSPDDAISRTLTDGSVLFTLALKVIGMNRITATLKLTDDPREIEFADENYQVLPVSSNDSKVEIFSQRKAMIDLVLTENTSCDDLNPDGTATVSMFGNTTDFEFHWYEGNEVTGTPDHTGNKYNGLSSGKYSLRVLDAQGKVYIDSTGIEIHDDASLVRDIIYIDSLNKQYSCSNLADDLTGHISILINDQQDITDRTITWYSQSILAGNELTAFQNSFEAGKLSAGQYIVVVENSLNGCITSEEVEIIDSLAYPEAEITERNDTLFANSDEAQWYRNDLSLNTTGQYLKPSISGFYHITIINEYGCTTESDPVNFGITSVSDHDEHVFQVYPVPFDNNLTVKSLNEDILDIQILDINGKMVCNPLILHTKECQIDMAGIAKGMYILRISTKNKEYLKKITKEISF